MDLTIEEFAAAVGTIDPVSIEGLATRGGAVPKVSTVRAPSGIVRVDAAEMVIECGAATPVVEVLDALRDVGQTVSVPATGTVGGALAVGHSDVTRLAHGPIRDTLLQTHYVSASGRVVKAGGPTVKNVSGFDMCRLLVGSLGTLGFLGDVILRTRPLARTSAWFTCEHDPFELLAELFRPVSLLWNGETTWVRLDGDAGDVRAASERYGLVEVDGPPVLPAEHRWSVPPGELSQLSDVDAGSFVAEIGVGVVHHSVAQGDRGSDAARDSLHRRIKDQFDPAGRLNPGVDPLSSTASG